MDKQSTKTATQPMQDLAKALETWDVLGPEQWRALDLSFPEVLSRRINALDKVVAAARAVVEQPSEPEVYLARYGVNHNHGPHDPLLELMPDGYWTPWHIADQALRTKPAPAGEPVADTNERVSDQRLAELLHIATFSAFKASAMYELALALTELQQLRLTPKVPITAAAALDAIKAQMLKDPAFAWTWHCGLAMSIKDNLGANHGDANRAAAAFMRLAFEVDTSRQPETKEEK